MNSGSAGGFTRLKDDYCNVQKETYEKTAPMLYRMYEGQFEHCDKCVHDENNYWRPFDVVDVESDLKNITRAASRCPQFKYNPNCKKSGTCISTYDKSAPIVLAQECCPIVKNNIVRQTGPGFVGPNHAFCNKIHRK